jgi:hypothetical protein
MSNEPPATPAGWYPDPSGSGRQRWWDGHQWTDQLQPPSGGPPPPPFGSSPSGYGQPQGYGYGAQGYNPPNNYLAPAILTTLFCCLPFGIVSIVKASQVNSLWSAQRYDDARRASADAKRWAWIAFGCGAVIAVIWILAAVSSGSSTSY